MFHVFHRKEGWKYHKKGETRLTLNARMMGINFTIFILLISINSSILRVDQFLTMQLILSMPFLYTSSLARSRMSYTSHPVQEQRWDILGWLTFLIGYTFTLDCIGLLTAHYVAPYLAIVFFVANWILSISYALIEIWNDPKYWTERVVKESAFIVLQVFFGLLPALGLY